MSFLRVIKNNSFYKKVFLIIGIVSGYFVGSLFQPSDYVSENIRVYDDHSKHDGDVPVLRCIIFIDGSATYSDRIVQVLKTGYSRQCNETLFFSTSNTIANKVSKIVNVTLTTWDVYNWNFFLTIMQRKSAEWTYVGTDQSYLIPQNLRDLVRKLNPGNPYILGRSKTTKGRVLVDLFPLLERQWVQVENGVVFSNGAQKLMKDCSGLMIPRSSARALSYCAAEHDVAVIDPIDTENRALFQTALRNSHDPKPRFSCITTDQSDGKMKPLLCSDHLISMGGLNFPEMATIDFLSNLKVFGRGGVQYSNETVTRL